MIPNTKFFTVPSERKKYSKSMNKHKETRSDKQKEERKVDIVPKCIMEQLVWKISLESLQNRIEVSS